jgi:SOS-response transcriptional repressor LexA
MIRPLLSKRQQQVYDAIQDFHGLNGYMPGTRDLSEMTGINSTSMIRRYLKELDLLGYIVLTPHVARGIRLLEAS